MRSVGEVHGLGVAAAEAGADGVAEGHQAEARSVDDSVEIYIVKDCLLSCKQSGNRSTSACRVEAESLIEKRAQTLRRRPVASAGPRGRLLSAMPVMGPRGVDRGRS